MRGIALMKRILGNRSQSPLEVSVTPEMVQRARLVIYNDFVKGARWGAGGPESQFVQGETLLEPEATARAALEAALGGAKK